MHLAVFIKADGFDTVAAFIYMFTARNNIKQTCFIYL